MKKGLRTNSALFAMLACCLLVTASPVRAAIYHVAKTGNDANPGSAEQPWQTVQKAADMMVAGDTVLIGAGTYDEAVKTKASGSELARVVFNGQGVATLRQVYISSSFITLQNMTLSGTTVQYSRCLYMQRGGHYAIVSNVVVDAANALKVYGIEWQSPSTKPFGSDAASHCLIVDSRITGVLGTTAVSMMGDTNQFVGNLIHDIGQADCLRLWGRDNLIRDNVFTNNFLVPGVGNHADFIQTFGNNGYGSQGHIIENNLAVDIYGGLTQLEGNAIPEIRDWTFRNNVFANFAYTASCTVPGVEYYNNVFYNCNWYNKGHALTFGRRWYTRTSVSSSAPDYGLIAKDIEDGEIEDSGYYQVSYADIPPGSIEDGMTYQVAKGTGTAVVYGGISYGDKETFVGSSEKDYTETGGSMYVYYHTDPFLYNGTEVARTRYFWGVAGVSNYTSPHWSITVQRLLPNYADNAIVCNNTFLDCGGTGPNTGWYAFGADLVGTTWVQYLTNCVADYNHVAKNSYSGVGAGSGPVGSEQYYPWKFYELHGINGGNPLFVEETANDFRLTSGSPLVDAGVNLSALGLSQDLLGVSRPQGDQWDIGPFEYAGSDNFNEPREPDEPDEPARPDQPEDPDQPDDYALIPPAPPVGVMIVIVQPD